MPGALYLLIGVVVGGLLGLLVGWLLGRNRPALVDTRLEGELRQQVAQRESDLAQLRSQLAAANTASAVAQAKEGAITSAMEEQQAQQKAATAELTGLREQAAGVAASLASATAQLEAERKALAQLRQERTELAASLQKLQSDTLEQKELNGKLAEKVRFLEERLATERQQLEDLQQRFQKEFEAVANKLLVENSSRFGQQSSESLDKLLGPLRENLQDFRTRLESVDKHNLEHTTLLKEQISRIGTEAANLSKALKGDVKVLGNWGENMLDQILVKSGLQLGVHYRRQSGAKDEGGDQRYLDVVIDLPESRHLIIDSKVSLKAYEEYANSADEAQRQKHLEAHLDSIRGHFRGLGGKRYQDSLNISAPDFVLMYIPIEGAFFLAASQAPGLFSEALEKNVVLITNSTLLATLRTVAHVWRLADQQKHALEIADRGGKLYDKFVGFVTDLQEIGAALRKSQEVWAEANKKLHSGTGNLVRQAEQLKALGVKASKSLPAQLTAEEGGQHPELLPPPPSPVE